MHTLLCMDAQFYLKFERAPWTFAQNSEPIHRKMRILLYCYFCVWFNISWNYNIISLSKMAHCLAIVRKRALHVWPVIIGCSLLVDIHMIWVRPNRASPKPVATHVAVVLWFDDNSNCQWQIDLAEKVDMVVSRNIITHYMKPFW